MLRNFSIVAQTTVSRNSAKNPSNAFLADIIIILLISIRTRLPSTPPRINHPHLLPRSSVAPDSTLSPLQPVTETRGNRVPKEEERSTGNERAQQPLRAHPPISQQTDRSDRTPPRPGGCSPDQAFLPSRTKLSPIRFHQASPRFSGDRRAGNHNIFAYSLLLGVTSVLTWV